MHVVILENHPSSLEGGQERSLLDVARGLAGRGHEITLLYVSDGDFLDAYRTFCHQVRRVNRYSIRPDRWVMSAVNLIQDLRQVPRSGSMVVYANQYLDSVFAAAAAAWRGCPFVCHLRLPPPDAFCGQYRMGMSRASHLIAVSAQTRRDYAAHGFRENAMDVVHNGIDSARFPAEPDQCAARARFGVPAESFVITYAGRFHPAKGIESLMTVFSMVRRDCPNAKMAMAGAPAILPNEDGSIRDYESELKRHAEGLEIVRDMIWAGHVENTTDLFIASDVVVLPSLWSEPFGRVLIEAMACGTPAIGSRVGGIPEILTGEFASFLFAPGHVGEMTNILRKLGDWRKQDPDLARRCRTHVARNFPLERTVEGVERALFKALESFRSGHRPRTGYFEIH